MTFFKSLLSQFFQISLVTWWSILVFGFSFCVLILWDFILHHLKHWIVSLSLFSLPTISVRWDLVFLCLSYRSLIFFLNFPFLYPFLFHSVCFPQLSLTKTTSWPLNDVGVRGPDLLHSQKSGYNLWLSPKLNWSTTDQKPYWWHTVD